MTILMVVASACGPTSSDWQASVEEVPAGTSALLIGMDSAGPDVVWLGGTGGTYGRSSDGGRTWTFGTIPGADSLQFRDVHAIDSASAYLLSIGPGEQSRIYRTDSGGESWDLQWINPLTDGFFDCFDFWSPTEGVVMGDAVDGRITIARTSDGQRWEMVDPSLVPMGTEGEGGFAASGTCLVAAGDSTVWIGTGSKEGSKVYRSVDRGASWDVRSTPIVTAPEAAGITTLAFLDLSEGYAGGVDLSRSDEHDSTFAATTDGGSTWDLRGRPQISNVYGMAVQRVEDSSILLAVGPDGMDVSFDGGWRWSSIDERDYWSVHFVGPLHALAVGPGGRISRVTISRTTGP